MSAAIAEREQAPYLTAVEPIDNRPMYDPLCVLKINSLRLPPDSKKIDPEESVDIQFVRRNMEPFVDSVYGDDLVIRKHKPGRPLTGKRGALVKPVGRWGEGAFLWISLGDPPGQSIDSLPKDEQRMICSLHADMLSLKQAQHPGRPVITAFCYSGGGMQKPQSVLSAHTQTLEAPEELKDMTAEQIIQWRAQQRGDGVGKYVGGNMEKAYRNIFPQYGLNNVISGHDGLGSYAFIPGFTPQDLANPYVPKLMETLSHTEHYEVRMLHGHLYKKPLDNIISMVQKDARKIGKVNLPEYFQQFEEKPPEWGESEAVQLLRRYMHHEDGNKLRHTFGWSGGWWFDRTGALWTQNPSFILDMPSGGMENYGILLQRSRNLVSVGEMRAINKEYHNFSNRVRYVSHLRRLHNESLHRAA